MDWLKRSIYNFYQRNLFERLALYIIFSGFFVKLFFELILGQWYFAQSQNLQWIFYALLGIDYIVSYKKIIRTRVSLNLMSIFAVICLVMIAHGLFIGILRHNQPFVILNDTIPLLMIALNILRMQSYEENPPIDFKFLFKAGSFLALGACLFGFIAQSIGNPSQPSMGNGTVYIPLFFAALVCLRPFPKWLGIMGLIMFGLVLDDFNRTSILFILIVMSGYGLYLTIKNPIAGFGALLIGILIIGAGWMALPKDSKTYERISTIQDIDLSQRTGSVGERQAEWDAIQQRLSEGGRTVEWTGLGFGGLYNVRFTHQYNHDYGHAHYSWAWFNMRFGKIGYLYLFIMLGTMLYNAYQGLRIGSEIGIYVSFLCLMGMIFFMTHVNSVFLLSGMHFLYLRQKVKL